LANGIFGNTAGLKASQARALAKLRDRSVPAHQIVGATLTRDLLEISHELGRQLGLFIDRSGRISRVIVGSSHSLTLPEFERVRGVDGRLRGIRLVLTHLVADPLNREELADLAKLRLDLIAAVHRGPAGIQTDLATLTPAPPGAQEAFSLRIWPRAPLAWLVREEGSESARASSEPFELPLPFDRFVTALQNELVSHVAKARARQHGVRAMVLMVHDNPRGIEARRHELSELCRTAGVDLVELCEQRRPYPDPRTFFGVGKLRDVLVRALEQDVELLICDPELSASQARSIAEQTDLKVIDRTVLILDIFARHAKSSDGKLQVELAQQRYRLPKLVGHGTMMSRLAGGIGGQGPGETKLELDRRRVKDRIADLERRLGGLRKQREQRRAQRKRSGVPVVAIVGYTNAGKSTLLNTITNSEVAAEDKLFATLDPTVRRIRFPHDHEVVLLDTVGFIRDLPPALRQAFSATLEEIADADLILHMLDESDPDLEQQIATVDAVLADLGAGALPRFWVHNKCDLVEQVPTLLEHRGDHRHFRISALDRRSTRELVMAIESHLWAHGRLERDNLSESSIPAGE